MFLEDNYVHKNTPVHNLNPIIKFIVFLFIVFLLFLRISFLIQLLLMAFVGLILWKSDSLVLCKRIGGVYLVLLAFLYGVNFMFMKTPGFWSEDRMLDYHDLFNIYDRTGSKDPSKVNHGWFIGGEILKKTDGSYWFDSSSACLENHLKASNAQCSDTNFASGFSNLSNHKNWNIFPVETKNSIKYVAFAPAWYTISAYQLIQAFCLTNKITFIILLSATFTRTISLGSFSYALEDLFRPLKLMRLPNKIMALAVAISIRFVPSLISEAFRITRAQASRGIDYKNGRFRDKASALLSLFVPLFVISFIKAGELSEAMIARGYNTRHSRNEFKVCVLRSWELVVLFLSIMFVTCLYYFFSNSYYMGLIEGLETLAIIAR